MPVVISSSAGYFVHLTFFDLDQTLLATDSDYEWNRFLVDTGWVEAADYAAANERFAGQYSEGVLDIHEYQRFALGPLMIHGHETMAGLRERFVAERIAPHIAPHARGVLAYHRQRGDLIAIITATNAFVTAPIADLLAVVARNRKGAVQAPLRAAKILGHTRDHIAARLGRTGGQQAGAQHQRPAEGQAPKPEAAADPRHQAARSEPRTVLADVEESFAFRRQPDLPRRADRVGEHRD